MSKVQDTQQHPLRNRRVLTDLFVWLTKTFDLHARYPEIWSEKFMDGGSGEKWQELQLVGSMVGVAFALAAAPNDVEARIMQKTDEILAATGSAAWKRIDNAQTKTQLDYIARIAKGLLTILDLEPSLASAAVRHRFGSSGYESLASMILPQEDR
jgi:hypothetical protein